MWFYDLKWHAYVPSQDLYLLRACYNIDHWRWLMVGSTCYEVLDIWNYFRHTWYIASASWAFFCDHLGSTWAKSVSWCDIHVGTLQLYKLWDQKKCISTYILAICFVVCSVNNMVQKRWHSNKQKLQNRFK